MNLCSSYNKVILAILFTSYFIFYFAFVGISVLTPEIIKEPNIDKNTIGMMIFVSGLIRLPEKLISGFLADFLNQKWLYICCGIIKYIFVLAFTQARRFEYMLLFWSLQEISWGPIWPCNVKIMNNWFDKHHIATALAILNLSYLFGDSIIRIIIGVMIYHGIYWRKIMVLFTFIGIGFLGIVVLFVKNKPSDRFIWQICTVNDDVDVYTVDDVCTIDNILIKNEKNNEKTKLLADENRNMDNDKKNICVNCQVIWSKHWRHLLINPCFWALFVTVATISFSRYTLFYWTPLYLVYLGASDSFAVIGSLVLPFAGGIGAIVIGILDDKMETEFRKNIVMFIFFILSCIGLFFLWLIQDQQWQSVNLTLIMYGIIGFFLLGAYTLPSGVMAIRFGSDCSGNAASLLEFAGGIAMALSGLMSRIISNNNDWGLIWYICLLSSIGSFVSLFIFVLVNKVANS